MLLQLHARNRPQAADRPVRRDVPEAIFRSAADCGIRSCIFRLIRFLAGSSTRCERFLDP